jgi:A/G-specific adenine glycosylase
VTALVDPRADAAIASAAETWFAVHRRDLPWRDRYDPYEIWISETMLQQTRIDVVVPYFVRFTAAFPDVSTLAAAPEEAVLALWSGLGYYRRARFLHRAAGEISRRFGGTIPRDPDALISLPGVGRYTAGAIASIGFDLPAPVVDGNVARLASRLDAVESRKGSAAFERQVWRRATGLVGRARSPRSLNQALMEIGSRVCRPAAPLCGECPLALGCAARERGDAATFPRRAAKRPPTRLAVPLYLVSDDRGRLLFLYHEGELMSGMYHLPHGTAALIPSLSTSLEAGDRLGSFRHSITQRRVEFEVFRAAGGAMVSDGRCRAEWIDPAELASVPHPSYVRKAVALWAAAAAR